MVGEACLPSNAYYPRTPDYTLCSGVHVCWSEHSDSSVVYGFMSLDYGFGTITATTFYIKLNFSGSTSLGPWKFVLDMRTSSHWGLVIHVAHSRQANCSNSGVFYFRSSVK